MDEILIDEKRYISSKRAAELTGYAKDYVGQLCREGRVPARLIGRSWYVLESAIQDHRFGAPKEEPTQKEEEPKSALPPTWKEPKYEAAATEEFPFINKLREHKEEPKATEKEGEEVAQDPHSALHEAWHEWFAQSGVQEGPEEPEPKEEAQENPRREELAGEEESRDVPVPIRAIYHPIREELPEESLYRRSGEPMKMKELPYEEPVIIKEYVRKSARKARKSPFAAVLQPIGLLMAAIAVITAILGSGYIDSYAISYNQVHFIAGISLYNK